MSYSVPETPGQVHDRVGAGSVADTPLWEVFVRQRRGLAHVHVGSLHAADREAALQAARDVYTRRVEGVSVWVVPSSQITASDPDEAGPFFDSIDKPYRHATYYEIPDEIGHI